jgi:hypothetical protein
VIVQLSFSSIINVGVKGIATAMRVPNKGALRERRLFSHGPRPYAPGLMERIIAP